MKSIGILLTPPPKEISTPDGFTVEWDQLFKEEMA